MAKLMDFLGRFVPAIVGCIAIAVWWNMDGLTESVALPEASTTVTTITKWTAVVFLYILGMLGLLMIIKSISLFVRFFREQ